MPYTFVGDLFFFKIMADGLVPLTRQNAQRGLIVIHDHECTWNRVDFKRHTIIRVDADGVKYREAGLPCAFAWSSTWADLARHSMYIVPAGPDDECPFLVPVRYPASIGAEVVLRKDCQRPPPFATGVLVACTGFVATVRWGETNPVIEVHPIADDLPSELVYAPGRRLRQWLASPALSADEVLSRTLQPELQFRSVPGARVHCMDHRTRFAETDGSFIAGPTLEHLLEPETVAAPMPVAPPPDPVAAVASRPPPPRAPATPTDDDKAACVVCRANERDHICIPCMHIAYCVECVDAARALSQKCPICRADATVVSRVFH